MSDRSSDRKRSRRDSDNEDEYETDSTMGREIAATQKHMDSKGSGSQHKRPVTAITNESSNRPGLVAVSASASGRVHDIVSSDESVDLPEYVKQNANTLTFPEKVSRLPGMARWGSPL